MKDVVEEPTHIIDLIKQIGLIGEILGFHGKLGIHLKNKIIEFKEMEWYGVPKILNDDGTLKYFNTWKAGLGYLRKYFAQTIYASRKPDFSFINRTIDDMLRIEEGLDTFVEEVKKIIDARYNSHDVKVNFFFYVVWLTKYEYSAWLNFFID